MLQMLEVDYGFRRAVLSKGVLRGIDEDMACVDFCEWTMFMREETRQSPNFSGRLTDAVAE
jgi:hypothetical protein